MAPTLAFWEKVFGGYLEMLRAGPKGLSAARRRFFKAWGAMPFRDQDPKMLAKALRDFTDTTPVKARVLALVALRRPLTEVSRAVPNAGRGRRVRDPAAVLARWNELRAGGHGREEADAEVGRAVGLSARSIRALRGKQK